VLHEARPEAVVTPLRLKIDPGSVTTGLALLHEPCGEVVWAADPRGHHVGTISVRASGSCDVTTTHRRVGGISIRYCQPLQRVDGYRYAVGSRVLPPAAQPGSLRAYSR
jgi:hypothetical protein